MAAEERMEIAVVRVFLELKTADILHEGDETAARHRGGQSAAERGRPSQRGCKRALAECAVGVRSRKEGEGV